MARQPFFGRGPAPQIARMDMPAATAPGRNWGEAFASIGQTVGQAVEKHRENKKAKKKERDFIDSFEARISKSPEFAKSYGLNPEDKEEVRLAAKSFYNSPETRQLSQDFSRFQEKDRARKGATEYLDLMLPSQAETVEPSDSGIRDFFAQAQADDDVAGLASVQSPSAFAARLEGMPIESPEAKEMLLGRQLGLQKEKAARDLASQAREIAQSNAMLTNRLKVNAELRDQAGFAQGQRILAFTPDRHSLKIDGGSALAISGAIDHEATAVQIKDEALPSFNKGMAAFNRLMEYADQRGRENWMSSEDKTAAEALANELRGLLREDILGPGTVQESERAIIAEVLPNPTKYWSFTSGAEGKKRLLELRNSIANKFKERLRGLGLEVEGMANPANTRQLSTGKEVEIIFDPAE